MHFIRRAAFRAAASPSTSFVSKPRSITTSSPFLLRSKVQNGVSPSVFRRFASDEANSSEEKSSVESADREHGTVRSAIETAAESVSTYAGNAAESLTEGAERAKDTIVDGAAATAAGFGYSQRENKPSRPSYGDRDGGRRPFDNNRGGYGDRDGGRKPYDSNRGGDRRSGGVQGGRFTPPERNLVPTSSIYVGNLLFDVTAADIQKEFEQFGPIKNAIIASDARGLSKGFGYIEFESTAQATAAIEAKHQSVLEGRRLVVNYQAQTKRDAVNNPPSKTLFIGNLAFEMSDADLNKLFRDIRNVIDVRVAIDRRTGQPRGFAHADFVDVESASKGLEALQNKEIYGRKLRVDYSASASSPRAPRIDSRQGDDGGEAAQF